LKARIVGVGAYLPDKRLTNFDLEKMVDTSDEWILTRSGIRERRICEANECSSTMGAIAAQRALDNAGVKAKEIDMIVVSTLAADMLIPSVACFIQKEIGAVNAAAFDVNGACTGFIYALAIATKFIETKFYKKILVVAAECCSKFVDWQDRSTCVLFGDGAGAVVLTQDKRIGIEDIHLFADGNLTSILTIPAGGSQLPATTETVKKRLHYIKMDGPQVYKAAVSMMNDSINIILEKSGISKEQIDFFIPHQANIRIIESLRKRLGLPPEKVLVNVDKYGNTSSATIPISLAEAISEKKVNKGDRILITAAGAGFTSGSIIFKL